MVFAVAEFTQGAWVVVVVMPLIVFALVGTNREYREEDAILEEGAAVEACEAKVLRRHVVVVLVDKIDLATARAIQYARTLTPDDLPAVHFNIDQKRAELLIARWQQLGLARLPLDVIDCPDRRLGRAALELAAELGRRRDRGQPAAATALATARRGGESCTTRPRTASSTS